MSPERRCYLQRKVEETEETLTRINRKIQMLEKAYAALWKADRTCQRTVIGSRVMPAPEVRQ